MNSLRTTFSLSAILLWSLTLGFCNEVVGQDSAMAATSYQAQSAVSAARKLMSKNQNAEALDILKSQSKLVEKKLAKERDSLINSMEESYKVQRKSRRTEIREKEQEIAELKDGNAGIEQENLAMTTQTIAFFSILISLIVVILVSRFKLFAGLRSQLNQSTKLLQSMDQSVASEPDLQKRKKIQLSVVEGAISATAESESGLQSIISDRQNRLQKPIQRLLTNLQTAKSVLSEKEEVPGVFVKTDLNALITETAEEAYHSMTSIHQGFNCVMITDLEKILPQIEVIPDDIRYVLFNILINAFESVHEKSGNSPKGYEPKVVISTRKLPRFVQIRVKDNGIGIPDKIKGKIFEPYFSTKNNDRNPGLGLSESYELITVKHKGELFVESDFSNSTDFIIRFPTLTIM